MKEHLILKRDLPFKDTVTRRFSVAVLIASMTLLPTASAEILLYDSENFKAAFSAKAAGFIVTAAGAGSGGTADPEGQAGEIEGTFEPQLDLSYTFDSGGTIYSRISYVGAASGPLGNMAPYGYVTDGDHRLINEWGNLGWKNDWLDISIGAQDFVVGDALLIGDGSLDCGNTFCGRDSGEFYIGAHKAFRESVIIRVNELPKLDNWRSDVFWIEGGTDIYKGQETQLLGVNVEYKIPEGGVAYLSDGTFGAMYASVTAAKILDAGNPRDGRRFYNVRANNVKLARMPNTKFNAEVIIEGGNGLVGEDVVSYSGAHAYYVEVEHSLADTPWNPVVGYRYYLGSGDDPLTAKNESHDSLFYTAFAGGRSWGTWFQGEFAGEWWHNNQNQRTHFAKLIVSPPVSWLSAIQLLGFVHEVDEGNAAGTYRGGDNFANEINLILEYWNATGFYIAGAFAHADIGNAGNSILGSDKDFNSFYVYLEQTF